MRVRNGEVCYWPNLGYGRFGAKVTMDHAPWFDAPDQFDQRRIRLADIDGSGTTDIIYLGARRRRSLLQPVGQCAGAPRAALAAFPPVDDVAAVQAADLLGNGTACLVWSSPLPGTRGAPMRYVDLMGGQKPHLLVRRSTTSVPRRVVHYAPSTKFYLPTRPPGRPWITALPFPVHVVERVETLDRISGNRFVTRYAYHHGYFDGVEREFRGFGMVEQWDTEELAALTDTGDFPDATNIDAASHVPPVLTRTWFHTGVISAAIASRTTSPGCSTSTGEYYREPDDRRRCARRLLLDDTVLPSGLSGEEEREACRALKGSMLRQEVYALDGSAGSRIPYVVTEQNFTVRRVAAAGGQSARGVLHAPARVAQPSLRAQPRRSACRARADARG